MRGHEMSVRKAANKTCAGVAELEDGVSVRLAGVIASMRTLVTKTKGERMALLTLEDFSGQVGVTVFASMYAKFREVLAKDAVVQISGTVTHWERPNNGGEKVIEVRLEDVRALAPALELGVEPDIDHGTVVIRAPRATKEQLSRLAAVLERHPGSYEVVFQALPEEEFPAVAALRRVEFGEGLRSDVHALLPQAKLVVHHPREAS